MNEGMIDMEEQMWIGFDDKHQQVVTDEETEKQIEKLMTYELALIDPSRNKVTWKDIYDPEEDRTILRYIVGDRKLRKTTLMADRPPFAIATIKKGKVIRLEFYEGHDELRQTFDIRSEENKDKQLDPTYKGW